MEIACVFWESGIVKNVMPSGSKLLPGATPCSTTPLTLGCEEGIHVVRKKLWRARDSTLLLGCIEADDLKKLGKFDYWVPMLS